ncbi:MAG TPA: ORF6N domain-containing protein [Opitutaceae bacterium]|nr:ORF6N domain-containing protein [Opitutaceae bacterium]
MTSSSTAAEASPLSSTGIIPGGRIDSRIYLIRGQKVLLDRDLAELYGTTTRLVNQAVRRNLRRFPSDFLFSLSRAEIQRISQFETSPGLKFSKSAYAFTEQGVAMLSGLLNSPRAIAVNIEIMRAFVRLRQMIASHADLARKLAALEKKYDEQFKVVFEAIRELMAPVDDEDVHREIGFHTALKPAPGKKN